MATLDIIFWFSYQVACILIMHFIVNIMSISEGLNVLEALGLAKWA